MMLLTLILKKISEYFIFQLQLFSKSKISRVQILKLKEPTWELDRAKVKAKARAAVVRTDAGC